MLLPKQNLQPTKTESLFAPQNWGERGVCGGGRRGGSGFHPLTVSHLQSLSLINLVHIKLIL